ncbi:MAG: hypothetical protein M0C28_47635 [Candidatus Moduliflexus flocculans]|nr:hypothetical protein [Candidatus Moduliflexus flocculans]
MLPAGERPGRDDRARPQLPPLRRLRAARRPGRQRPGGPGPVHARAPGHVPSRTSPTTSGRAPGTGGATSASTGRRSSQFLKERVRPADARGQARRVRHGRIPGSRRGRAGSGSWRRSGRFEYSKVAIERDDEAGKAFKGTTENVGAAGDRPGRLGRRRPGATADHASSSTDSKRRGRPRARAGPALLWSADDDGLEPAGRASTLAFERPAPRRRLQGRLPARLRLRLRHARRRRGGRARAFNKARFDAEMFWVRGNAGVEVVPDTAFDPAQVQGPQRHPLRQRRHQRRLGEAAGRLAGRGPRTARSRIGEKRYAGDRLSRPISSGRGPGATTASVGAVAWTGPAGWVGRFAGAVLHQRRRLPRPAGLLGRERCAPGRTGVRAIGWFGNDWTRRARRHRLERGAGEIRGEWLNRLGRAARSTWMLIVLLPESSIRRSDGIRRPEVGISPRNLPSSAPDVSYAGADSPAPRAR